MNGRQAPTTSLDPGGAIGAAGLSASEGGALREAMTGADIGEPQLGLELLREVSPTSYEKMTTLYTTCGL